jgi:hypothetical protein
MCAMQDCEVCGLHVISRVYCDDTSMASARLFTVMDPLNPNPAGSPVSFNQNGITGTINPVVTAVGTVEL